ncbi:unnamed protein product [Owenia fusiformis]|uniref:Uncharacterized protein n=1 Tax=Owenia fusiformis TaxID=6347 RepID=A0A8J1YAN3_OWEFU|nr:unnamed protein product [Owenia fusiformis]
MKVTIVSPATAMVVILGISASFVNGGVNWKQEFSKCDNSLTDVKAQLAQCKKQQGPKKECPLGFSLNQTFGSCYNFVTQEKMNWINALSFCNAQGANLVAIETQEELTFIREEIKSRGFASPGESSDSFYTGGTRINGEWQWIGGPSWPTKPMEFAPWYINEGSDEDEFCHILWSPFDHLWSDYWCFRDNIFNFICEIKIN